MPPKKKTGKKANDDWENEVAETLDPIAAASPPHEDEGAPKDSVNDNLGGGGLLAALKKNKNKKAKKGKPSQDDFVEGEDPTNADADEEQGLSTKAPEEAIADDLFDVPAKGKGGKGKQSKADEKPAATDGDALLEDSGLKSKKEKEKEKKEREKQRKKEQVR